MHAGDGLSLGLGLGLGLGLSVGCTVSGVGYRVQGEECRV